MKAYYCEWLEPSYPADNKTVNFDHFSDDLGYNERDRDEIDRLEINQTALLGMSDHTVKRVK